MVTALLDPPDRSTKERELKVFLVNAATHQSTHRIYRRERVFTCKVHSGVEDIRQFLFTVLGSVTRSLCLCMKVSRYENGFGFTLGLQGQDT